MPIVDPTGGLVRTQQQTSGGGNPYYQSYASVRERAPSGPFGLAGPGFTGGQMQGILGGLAQQLLGYEKDKFQLDQLRQSQAGIGLQREGLGIDRAALNRQLGYTDEQHDIAMRGLGFQGQRLGLEGQALGLRRRGIDIDERQTRRDSRLMMQQFVGEAAARGASGGAGTYRQMTDIRHDLADSIARYGLAKKGIALERKDLKLKRGELRLATRDEVSDYRERRAQIGDALKKLDLKGRELGLADGMAARAIELGLAELKMDQFFDLADLTSLMTQGTVEQQQMVNGFIQQVMKKGASALQSGYGG